MVGLVHAVDGDDEHGLVVYERVGHRLCSARLGAELLRPAVNGPILVHGGHVIEQGPLQDLEEIRLSRVPPIDQGFAPKADRGLRSSVVALEA